MTSGRVRGGFNQYGFTVGILILDTRFPRIPGDVGNAATFPFPVRYHRVSGADPDLVVRRGAEGLLPAFVQGARALEGEGVGAITTSCGFLAKYQQELAAAVRVPVFTSSLLMVPLVHRLLPAGRRVGIMTVNAAALGPEPPRRPAQSRATSSRSAGGKSNSPSRSAATHAMVCDSRGSIVPDLSRHRKKCRITTRSGYSHLIVVNFWPTEKLAESSSASSRLRQVSGDSPASCLPPGNSQSPSRCDPRLRWVIR